MRITVRDTHARECHTTALMAPMKGGRSIQRIGFQSKSQMGGRHQGGTPIKRSVAKRLITGLRVLVAALKSLVKCRCHAAQKNWPAKWPQSPTLVILRRGLMMLRFLVFLSPLASKSNIKRQTENK